MSMSVIEAVNALMDEVLVNEVAAVKKKVVRGGEVVIKMDCPDGFKWNAATKNCVKMTPAEVLLRSKAALRAAKSRAKKSQSSAMRARDKSLRLREMKNL